MTLENTIADTGFSATLSGYGTIINTDDLIGIYAFQVNSVTPGNSTIGSQLYEICLSPQGNATSGYAGNYTLQTFAQPGHGSYSSAWTAPAGIQNANYLFNTFAPKLEGGNALNGFVGSVNDQASAMAWAMYTALYNSTAPGVAADGTPTSGFNVALTGNLLQDYNLFLGDLATGYNSSSSATGYVLTPSSGQSAQPLLFSSVPETSTLISGALMVLPFGASTLRILRKKRAA
jgi:hypothetical protein